MFNDFDSFFSCTHLLRNLSEHSKEVWIIPYVETTLIDELSFISWWYISCNHKIDNICIPGVRFGDMKEHIIPE
jgi:hypothetical protein